MPRSRRRRTGPEVAESGRDVAHDAVLNGLHVLRCREDGSDEEVVPDEHEDEDGDGGDAGADQWESRSATESASASTVDGGGLFDLDWDVLDEVPQEQIGLAADDRGVDDDQHRVGVDQRSLDEHRVERDEDDDGGTMEKTRMPVISASMRRL